MSVLRNDSIQHPSEQRVASGPVSYVRILSATYQKIRRYYGLLLALIVAFMMAGVAIAALTSPEYTAVAVVGPAPSPLGADISGLAGGLAGALGSGITKKLGIGGAAAGSSDLFDQYCELLVSSRLAERLAQEPNVTRAMLYKRFDWEKHRWKSPEGIWGGTVVIFKRLFHYPVTTVPDADDIAKALKKDVTISAPLTSSFVTVSLTSDSPEKAEWLLNVLLLDADTLIREDKRRDVTARIAYLSDVLPRVIEVSQRDALTLTLSTQLQTLMVLKADKRYASALVDPPHAPLIPSSPSLLMTFGTGFVLALVCWGCLVTMLAEDHWLLQASIFAPRRRRGAARRPAAPATAVGRAREDRLGLGASRAD